MTAPLARPWDPRSEPRLQPGSTLADRYVLQAILGQGGSGTVFRAWDRALGCLIAIKVIRDEMAQDPEWIRRLAREVRLARSVRHPNVCAVFDVGQSQGHWFVTMELARGGTLRDELHSAGPADQGPKVGRRLSSWPRRASDARAVCAGLAAVHAMGIIHGDVTPRNILRMEDGRLTLADFGMALPQEERTTLRGGTPIYLPPEVLMGARADQRSDLWQLGLVLHEILFDRRPDWGPTDAFPVFRRPSRKDLPPEATALVEVCAGCLVWNPAARPATATWAVERLGPRRGWGRLRRWLAALGPVTCPS
jgi:serine/threonine protein kinase